MSVEGQVLGTGTVVGGVVGTKILQVTGNPVLAAVVVGSAIILCGLIVRFVRVK